MEKKYRLVRSARRTLAMEITREGELVVRAPRRLPLREIEAFIEKHEDWVAQHFVRWEERQKKQRARAEEPIGCRERQCLLKQAARELPPRVERMAARMGVSYGRITIRSQKTLWGSCSAKGNLSFNCLLMKLPEEVTDYVIVHELAHRRHMNHSRAFWQEVERVMPDYRERRRALKETGGVWIEALREGERLQQP
ncbi:M48 family metallopeptidase [Lachnoclostridium sp. Marseille-P6806]|uniref:M48 family metallopeptidase n=1 Tax=Lachnoclostridium sp. Marseille-P6806 TaxID=2364793 RepID=UPI001031BC9C|nr:M48 family metallopeptidase [Lachnoclostridium sp. Marseille-P6806]